MTTTVTEPATSDNGHRPDGRVVAIAGPVVDVEFPPHALPEINMAVEMDLDLDGNKVTVTAEVAQQIGEGRVRCVCLKATDGLHRGTPVRNLGPRPGRAGGGRHAGTCLQRAGGVARHRRHRGCRGPVGDPPRLAGLRPARAPCAHVRDRHQGDRPARALRPGREDRPVRRGGRRQDRAHPGDDQPGRAQPRWGVGVRRCGRAHP